jgi:hypothetical protein
VESFFKPTLAESLRSHSSTLPDPLCTSHLTRSSIYSTQHTHPILCNSTSKIKHLANHANTLSSESLPFSPARTNFTFTMEFQINRIHQKEQDLPTGGNWVVQKFGGTSVGKFAVGIAQDIVL